MPTSDRPAAAPGQLKVMISSTALDLPNHRKAAMDSVLRAGCFPLAMEHGTATSNSDAIRFSLELVDQADIYLGIFALRYGFIPDNAKDNPQRWSVTEHEYRRAIERGIPRLNYLADKDHKFSEEEIDFDPEKRAKLKALKEELERREICAFFLSPEELHSRVVQSLFEEKGKQRPALVEEPIFSTLIPQPPELYAVPPYTLTDTFVGREAEFSDLKAWAASSDTVLVVEAIGGMGKSALTWEWVQRQAETSMPELAGRIWWSFYERGTSMKTFLRHALAYVTRQNPDSLKDLATYDCGQQLLVELKRKPYLLVLDGFERVLTAYHRTDKAQLRDDQVPVDARECTNPRDGDVLRQLVHCRPSKVLVSTRLMPKVLEDRDTHRPIPGVRHLELEGLAPTDALKMVRNAGIRGNAAAILRFVDQFDRHSLVLRIVCGMITDYRPKPGDFDAWHADPYAGGGLKLSELPLKQRYTHILEYAFRGLAEKSRQLLSRIAVLSDGAHYDVIAALNPLSSSEDDKALANFHSVLQDLEDRGLLQWDRKTNTYDLHPVVRAYAFEQLGESDRAQAYDAIRDHFASLPPENLKAATDLEHVKNALEIMRALTGAGHFNDAINFYQGEFGDSLFWSFGAYPVVVELLSPLLRYYRSSSTTLSSFSSSLEMSYIMNDLGLALFHLDRLEEANTFFVDKFPIDLEWGSWGGLSTGIRNWSSCIFKCNQIALACRAVDLSSDLSLASDDIGGVTRCILEKVAISIVTGKLDEADLLLSELNKRDQPERSIYRPGDMEYWFCVLRFYQGKLTANDLCDAERITLDGNNRYSLHRLFSLRAEWELARGNYAATLDSIEQALSIVRRAGEPQAYYLGIRALALARLERTSELYEALAEAEDAWSGRTPALATFATEAWLALGDRNRALEYVRLAYPLAWADGPPYSRWYDLRRCRELMVELGEPEPQLPPFDARKVEPIPFEMEIRAAIEMLKADKAKREAAEAE